MIFGECDSLLALIIGNKQVLLVLPHDCGAAMPTRARRSDGLHSKNNDHIHATTASALRITA
jgi:hypothetical protein